MSRGLRIIWNGLLDILFPKTCLGCGREGTYICKDCEIFLSEADPMLGSPISPKILGEVGLPDIVSVWEHEGLMEKLILKIKYDGCYDIINDLVAKAFEKITLGLPQDTMITFVPMWGRKERRRGFNQAELIARAVGEKTGRPVAKLLEKIKDNRSQVGLSPQERAENVRGAFRVTPDDRISDILGMSDIPNIRNVLVVDDVYTTGATMGECIKVLKKAGAKNVWGFTLSRKMSIQNC